MNIDRRTLRKSAGLVSLIGSAPRLAWAVDAVTNEQADHTLRIGPGLVELAPKHIVSTVLYDGQFPGPLLRLKEGQRVVVDIHHDTDTPELVHWHGQMIPSDVDGAAAEGSPYVPAHGTRRIAFVPKPGRAAPSKWHFFARNVRRGLLASATFRGRQPDVLSESRMR